MLRDKPTTCRDSSDIFILEGGGTGDLSFNRCARVEVMLSHVTSAVLAAPELENECPFQQT